MNDKTELKLLADKPAEEFQESLQALSLLINSAKSGDVVLVVGTDKDTGEEAMVICATMPVGEGNLAAHIPIARMFSESFMDIERFKPPSSALPAEELEDEEDGSSETS